MEANHYPQGTTIVKPFSKATAAIFALLIAFVLIATPASVTQAATTKTIKFSESEINFIMAVYPTPAQIKSPYYSLQQGYVAATFKITESTGITYNAVLNAAPQIVNGKVLMHITKYTWNVRAVPGYELQEFNDALPTLNAYIDQALKTLIGANYKVQKVTITRGLLTITATI